MLSPNVHELILPVELIELMVPLLFRTYIELKTKDELLKTTKSCKLSFISSWSNLRIELSAKIIVSLLFLKIEFSMVRLWFRLLKIVWLQF